MKYKTQAGFTLIELTVVLLVLIALAGLAIPYMSGTSSKALCDATDVSMQNIKRVIMDRYYLDTLGYFPKSTKAGADYNLKYLFEAPTNAAGGGWDSFDPDTQLGWRGPYLQGGILLESAASLLIETETDQLKNTFTNTSLKFVHVAIQDNDPVILDAWGRPIVIQVKNLASNTVRLISAGSNGVLDTKITDSFSPQTVDDRVLYLQITPANEQNLPCS